MKEFRVICRLDRTRDGDKGKYTLATSKTFLHVSDAVDYAKTVSPSREPKVLLVVVTPEEIHPEHYAAFLPHETFQCPGCDEEKPRHNAGYVEADGIVGYVCNDCYGTRFCPLIP